MTGIHIDHGLAARRTTRAAISINLERILQFPALPHRAAMTLVLFALPLVTALLLIVPGQPDAALGSELLVIGLVVGTFLIVSDARVPLSEEERPVATRLVSRTLPPIVTCGSLAVAGGRCWPRPGAGCTGSCSRCWHRSSSA